jgi:hypothetical protein
MPLFGPNYSFMARTTAPIKRCAKKMSSAGLEPTTYGLKERPTLATNREFSSTFPLIYTILPDLQIVANTINNWQELRYSGWLRL